MTSRGVHTKQAEHVQDVLASGRHVLSLISDILDLSKVEAGRMELAPFHLPSALESALMLMRERATRHGIALGLEVYKGSTSAFTLPVRPWRAT